MGDGAGEVAVDLALVDGAAPIALAGATPAVAGEADDIEQLQCFDDAVRDVEIFDPDIVVDEDQNLGRVGRIDPAVVNPGEAGRVAIGDFRLDARVFLDPRQRHAQWRGRKFCGGEARGRNEFNHDGQK